MKGYCENMYEIKATSLSMHDPIIKIENTGQDKNPNLQVSSYFHIYGCWVILGEFRLVEGQRVPRRVRKLAWQG